MNKDLISAAQNMCDAAFEACEVLSGLEETLKPNSEGTVTLSNGMLRLVINSVLKSRAHLEVSADKLEIQLRSAH